jgi:hypothetical protein
MVFQRRAVLSVAVVPLLVMLGGCTKEVKKELGQEHVPLAAASFPSKAGVCKYVSTGNCTTGSTGNSCTPGGPCNISLAINGNQGVDVTLNGAAQPLPSPQIVCVPKSTPITWNVPAASSSFLADFGNGTPFSDNQNLTYITGATGQPSTDSTINEDGCYKYNIKVCPIPLAPGSGALTCGETDPVVIVGSGNTLAKQGN